MRTEPYLVRYACIMRVRDWCQVQGLERGCGE